MIIVPLGLGRKLPHFPAITMLLVGVTIAISAYFFPQLREAEQSIYAFEAENNLGGLTGQLWFELCQSQSREAADCQSLLEIAALIYDKEGRAKASKRLKEYFEGEPTEDRKEQLKTRKREKRLRRLFSEVSSQVRLDDKSVQGLASYSKFKEAKTRVASSSLQVFVDKSFLAAGSISWLSLLKAQFIHSNFVHLFANMFMFLVFAIYVEQRVNRLSLLGIYFLGGSLGLLAHVGLLMPPGSYLVGASANVSAVLGAFFALFLRRNMRFIVSMIFYNKSVRAPILMVFPLLFIISDVTGFLGNQLVGGQVAHFAHLMGLGVGGLVGMVVVKVQNLHSSFMYPFEVKLYEQMSKTTNLEKKTELADVILNYHPENELVMEEALESVLKEVNGLGKGNKYHSFVEKHLPEYLRLMFRKRRLNNAVNIMSLVPKWQSYSKLLGELRPIQLIRLGDKLLERGDLVNAMKVYDFYLISQPNAKQARQIETTLDNCVGQLLENRKQVGGVKLSDSFGTYLDSEKRSRITSLLARHDLNKVDLEDNSVGLRPDG